MSRNEQHTANITAWPDQINAAAFKAHSNSFVGADNMALFKTMVSIRTMVGLGMALALLLPMKIVALGTAMMTLPQLIVTLARYFHLMEDSLRRAHPVLPGRYTAEIEGDFAVFHIGFILNGHIPTREMKQLLDSFNSMLGDLEGQPEKYGFYGSTTYTSANTRVDSIMAIQYWRSQHHLNAFARDRLSSHFPSMQWLGKVAKVSTNVGFWHESFAVHAGEHESIYVHCPQILLGKAGKVVPATGQRRTARGRLGLTDGNDLNPLDPSRH